LVTTINSAELIKHASNSFLALKISYANMIADLAERLGADIQEVTTAVGMDSRIGRSFLNAGLGFGGFCLPKDLQAFVHLAEKSGVDFSLLKEVEKINRRRIRHVIEKVRRALWVVKGKPVAVLGLAFKANTDRGNGESTVSDASGGNVWVRLRSGERCGSPDPRHGMEGISRVRLGAHARRNVAPPDRGCAEPPVRTRNESARLRILFDRPTGLKNRITVTLWA
jgi:hypothetical protein